jgi:hypothetical protein
MRNLEMQTSVGRSVRLARGAHVTPSNDVGFEGSVWQNAHRLRLANGPDFSSLRLDLESIEAGVPDETITSFVLASGVELEDIYTVVTPARTLKHRRSRQRPLSSASRAGWQIRARIRPGGVSLPRCGSVRARGLACRRSGDFMKK